MQVEQCSDVNSYFAKGVMQNLGIIPKEKEEEVPAWIESLEKLIS
jgi:hypothetical protein